MIITDGAMGGAEKGVSLKIKRKKEGPNIK